MKHINVICIGLGLLTGIPVFAQVSLPDVLSAVRIHAPEYETQSLISRQTTLQRQNLDKQWLPQFGVTGQATYQSDVTSIGAELPGVMVPVPPKFQYHMQGEVQQTLYDGGVLAGMQEAADLMGAMGVAESEMQLEQLRGEAITLYFAIIESDFSSNILEDQLEQLQSRRAMLLVRVRNGALLESELYALDAAILDVEQHQIALETQRASWLSGLSVLTGENYANSTFSVPGEPQFGTTEDLAYRSVLNYQQLLSENALDQQRAAAMPRLTAFGQAGVGQPGLNFLDDALASYYVVGLRFSLNLNRLYTRRNEQEIAALENEKIRARQDAFERSVTRAEVQYENEIGRYAQEISNLIQLAELRGEITRVKQVQLEQGAATPTEYVDALNDEQVARERLAQAEARKLRAQYLLQQISGAYTKTN